MRDYRLKNKDRLKEQAKQYRLDNKKIIDEKRRIYYEKNKEIKRGMSQVYYWENREVVRTKAKERAATQSAKERKKATRIKDAQRGIGRWKILERSTRNRPGILAITIEEFLVWHENNKECAYCGSNFLGTGHGVDRVDSNKNYSLDNIAACCRYCNVAKASLTLEQFKTLITRIYERLINKR